MRLFLIVFFVFYQYEALGQSVDSILIKLQILDDTIRTQSATHKVIVEYSVTNVSDTSLILYRFMSRVSAFPSKRTDMLCDLKKTGAGTVFLLYDESLKWRSGKHWIVSDYTRPMTRERMDSAMSIENANALKETVVLKKDEVVIIKQEINTKPFSLSKGSYYIELIYSAGEKIDLFVSEERRASDMNIYQAKVYQGCVKSQKVLIIVN